MTHHLRIAALLALSLAGTAHATSQVTTTLSNFQLTTTGTVTPYASEFLPGHPPGTMLASSETSSGVAQVDAGGTMRWVNRQEQSIFTIIDGTKGETPASWDHAPASSTASGTATAHAQVNDDLSMVATVSTGTDGGYASAAAAWVQSFMLEANSSITATWNVSIVGNNVADTFALSTGDHAHGIAGAFTSAPANLDSRTWMFSDDYSALEGFSFVKDETARTLTFRTGNVASWVFMRVEAIASTTDFVGQSLPVPVPDVPEPETWAMALIGLVLMGVRSRRHQR